MFAISMQFDIEAHEECHESVLHAYPRADGAPILHFWRGVPGVGHAFHDSLT